MPNQDQTGPAGLGRMTGRGAGPCAGIETPGCIGSRGVRQIRGRGRGRGRGGNGLQFRQRNRETITALQDQIHRLEDELLQEPSDS